MSALYMLVACLAEKQSICVGALGQQQFTPGYYVYTGSGSNALSSRAARHLRSDKKLHWHIDYLLQPARVEAVRLLHSTEHTECSLHAWVTSQPGAESVCRGFGSSDCSCFSHLVRFERFPAELFGAELIKEGESHEI